jgi:hypothetical protein
MHGGESSCVRFVGFVQDGWMGWGEGGDMPMDVMDVDLIDG